MKILLVSDTHQITGGLKELLAQYENEVKLVCHLGDHAQDLMRFRSEYPQISMVAVKGNCDYSPEFQPEITLQITACMDSPDAPSVKILLVHGHNNGVKRGLDRLAYYAREKGVDACFFGHTHFPVMSEMGGVLMMNPGSIEIPRGGSKASYGLVEISPQGEITGRLVAR